MKSWIHFLGGSVSVYLLMAACSAGSKHGGTRDDPQPAATQGGTAADTGGADAVANAGTSMPNGTSGDTATAGTPGGGLGGMIGDMMDPVDDADAAPATSGTRLRARYYLGEDGSKQFIGWHDKMRDEDCSFWKAADGVLRCTPFYITSGASAFSDAGCSVPVIIAAKATGSACGVTAPPAKYLYLSDACGAARQRYTVATQPTGGTVFSKSGAACTDITAGIAASYDVFSLTSPTPAPDSAFVAATEQVE
jgi:hypothetical protein